MNIVLTPLLKGIFKNPDGSNHYTNEEEVRDTNQVLIPLRKGIFGLRSITIKKITIPCVLKTINNWPEMPYGGRAFYWRKFDTGLGRKNISIEILENFYTGEELADYLETQLNSNDLNNCWSIIYIERNRRMLITNTEASVNNVAKIFFSKMPVLAKILGFPAVDLYINQLNSVMAPFNVELKGGVSQIYLKIHNIDPEDFQLTNIQDNDNIFSVFTVPNMTSDEYFNYIPPIEHTIYFEQSITLNHIHISFLANFEGTLYHIPFGGKEWLIEFFYSTRNSNQYIANINHH